MNKPFEMGKADYASGSVCNVSPETNVMPPDDSRVKLRSHENSHWVNPWAPWNGLNRDTVKPKGGQ